MSAMPPASAAARPLQGSRAAQLLSSELGDGVIRREEGFGEETVVLHLDRLVAACELLRDHPDGRYTMPLFMSAVDHLDREPEQPRFDLVYQLRSLMHNDVCRLVVQVTEDHPHAPTLENVFPGMDWHERECFDLFGIIFDGHHNLQRILMPEDWEGHPLRKDYVSFAEPIAFTHNIEWALPTQERPTGMPGSSV